MTDLYERLRDYLKHEDNLINWRLTWGLGFQGIAFAGWLAVLTKQTGTIFNPKEVDTLVRFQIPAVGFAFAATSLAGIYAAQLSIQALEQRWEEQRDDPAPPRLTGGGSRAARILGQCASLGPLTVTILFWFGLILKYWNFAGMHVRSEQLLFTVGVATAMLLSARFVRRGMQARLNKPGGEPSKRSLATTMALSLLIGACVGGLIGVGACYSMP